MSAVITIEHPFQSVDGTVKRVYILVHRPGFVPDKKIPPQTDDGVDAFLIELLRCNPAGTKLTVVELIWNGDIWVSDGAERLAIRKAAGPRKFAKFERHVIESAKQFKLVS